MSKRVGGEWFKEPVDLIQNPNYLGVIVKPMDFSTVRKKLETGQYQDPVSRPRQHILAEVLVYH
jgi:hypothetical protein